MAAAFLSVLVVILPYVTLFSAAKTTYPAQTSVDPLNAQVLGKWRAGDYSTDAFSIGGSPRALRVHQGLIFVGVLRWNEERGADEGYVEIYDSASFQIIHTIASGEVYGSSCIDVNDDVVVVASDATFGTVKLYSRDTFELLTTLKDHKYGIYSCRLHNDRLVIGGMQKAIYYYDISMPDSPILLITLSTDQFVDALALNDKFIVAGMQGKLRVWSLVYHYTKTWEMPGAIKTVRISSDGSIYAGNIDRTLLIWSPEKTTSSLRRRIVKSDDTAVTSRHFGLHGTVSPSANENTMYAVDIFDLYVWQCEYSSDGGTHAELAQKLHFESQIKAFVSDFDRVYLATADNYMHVVSLTYEV